MSELGLGERQIILKPAVSWTTATIVTLIPTIFFVMSGNKEKLLSWIQKCYSNYSIVESVATNSSVLK